MLPIEQDWSGGIDALVETANRWLGALLPADRSLRAKDEVNARLVRHYTTVGLLPPPRREGREARYGRTHLLHLLALRRLMAEGLSGRALAAALGNADEAGLERLATRGVAGAEPAPAAPPSSALEYLTGLRRQARLQPDTDPAAAAAAPLSSPPPSLVRRAREPGPARPSGETLYRVLIREGLELNVGPGVSLPQSEEAWAALLQEIRDALVVARRVWKPRQ